MIPGKERSMADAHIATMNQITGLGDIPRRSAFQT